MMAAKFFRDSSKRVQAKVKKNLDFKTISYFFVLVVLLGIVALVVSKPSIREGLDKSSSNMHTTNFLKLGLPVDSVSLILTFEERESYYKAIEKFPSPFACTDSFHEGIAEIKFDALDSLIDLEVCLFLIAKSLSNEISIINVLKKSGFEISPTLKYPSSAMVRYGEAGSGILISATMPSEKIPQSMLSIYDRFFKPYNLSIGVLLAESGSPRDVTVLYTRQ